LQLIVVYEVPATDKIYWADSSTLGLIQHKSNYHLKNRTR